MAAEEKTLQSLANCYFLIEGENPNDTSPYFYELKKDIWSKDTACYGFFLQNAFGIMRNLDDLSSVDILSYLREKAVEEVIQRSA